MRKEIDKVASSISSAGTKFFAWFFWVMYVVLSFNGISEMGFSRWAGLDDGETGVFFTLTAIWLWGTFRYLRAKGYIGKSKTKAINYSWGGIILKNVVFPVIVSLIVSSITGSPGLTLVSIPILGALSINLEA